jgi:uncharacterized iron-regulated protein
VNSSKELATLLYTIRGYNRAMTRLRLAVMVAVLVLAGIGLSAQSYVPNRVFDSARGQFADFESMVATLARADVVFVGEQHDDPNTHRLERAILEGLARRRGGLILSLEMFERDVQDRVEQFRLGHLSEAEFLATSRPWPRYATDYKPLVDFAVDQKWPIVAANIPRPIASEIAKAGLDVLRDKAAPDSTWFAKEAQCPTDDEYFTRFKEVMGTHANAEQVQLYYASQCLKDETMAESIVRAWRTAADATPGARPIRTRAWAPPRACGAGCPRPGSWWCRWCPSRASTTSRPMNTRARATTSCSPLRNEAMRQLPHSPLAPLTPSYFSDPNRQGKSATA